MGSKIVKSAEEIAHHRESLLRFYASERGTEWKKKHSECMKHKTLRRGTHHSSETRAKIRTARLGKRSSPEVCRATSERMKALWQNPEFKLRMLRAQRMGMVKKNTLPNVIPMEHKSFRLPRPPRLPKPNSKGSLAKMGNQYSRGHHMSEESKRKMSLARMGRKWSPESKAKKSAHMKALWQNPEYRAYTLAKSHQAANTAPNKCESTIMGMLNTIAPSEWAFVGDGKLWIESCNPDFINVNGKKQIIEHFGDYQHGEKPRKYQETEEGRKALFAKYGYSALIIWEHELKHPEGVMLRIKEFCSQEGGH